MLIFGLCFQPYPGLQYKADKNKLSILQKLIETLLKWKLLNDKIAKQM